MDKENPFDGMTESESIRYQLEEWVKGNSLHNPIRDECCPDFSCCEEGIETPEELKRAFMTAIDTGQEEAAQEILMGFLGTMLSHHYPDTKFLILAESDINKPVQ